MSKQLVVCFEIRYLLDSKEKMIGDDQDIYENHRLPRSSRYLNHFLWTWLTTPVTKVRNNIFIGNLPIDHSFHNNWQILVINTTPSNYSSNGFPCILSNSWRRTFIISSIARSILVLKYLNHFRSGTLWSNKTLLCLNWCPYWSFWIGKLYGCSG